MKAFIEQFRHFTHTADGEKPLFEVVGKAFAKERRPCRKHLHKCW